MWRLAWKAQSLGTRKANKTYQKVGLGWCGSEGYRLKGHSRSERGKASEGAEQQGWERSSWGRRLGWGKWDSRRRLRVGHKGQGLVKGDRREISGSVIIWWGQQQGLWPALLGGYCVPSTVLTISSPPIILQTDIIITTRMMEPQAPKSPAIEGFRALQCWDLNKGLTNSNCHSHQELAIMSGPYISINTNINFQTIFSASTASCPVLD